MSNVKADIKKAAPEVQSALKALLVKFNLIPGQAPAPVAPVIPAVAAPVQLQESTLADGTVLKYNTPTLAVGSECTIVSPEGELPAPEGEHKLSDGSTIKIVSKDGKSVVESIAPAAAAPDPMAQVAAQVATMKSELSADYEKKFSAFKAEKEKETEKVTALEAEVKTLRQAFAELVPVIMQIADLPTGEVIEPPANKQDKKQKIERFINR
jgi:hypothetical protein